MDPQSARTDFRAGRQFGKEGIEFGDVAGLRVVLPAMAIDDHQNIGGLDQIFDGGFTTEVLAEIEKIAAFIELDEGTGNRGAIFGFALDVPTEGFGNELPGAGRCKPHRTTVHGTPGK